MNPSKLYTKRVHSGEHLVTIEPLCLLTLRLWTDGWLEYWVKTIGCRKWYSIVTNVP